MSLTLAFVAEGARATRQEISKVGAVRTILSVIVYTVPACLVAGFLFLIDVMRFVRGGEV